MHLLAALVALLPAAADVGQIDGDWIEEAAIVRLEDRAALQALDPYPTMHALQIGRVGGSLRVFPHDFHDGASFELLGAEALADDRWRLRLQRGFAPEIELALERDADGELVRLRGRIDDEVEHAYRRLPEGIAAFVNRATVAGRYRGAIDGGSETVFEFRLDGSVAWAGRELRYEVNLDPSESECRHLFLSAWPHRIAERERIGFRREGHALLLHRVVVDDGEGGPPIRCETEAFARLAPEPEDAARGPRFAALPLRPASDAEGPAWLAEAPGLRLRFERNASLHGNDFGEAEGRLFRNDGASCTLPQDGWFERRGMWLSDDGGLLALAQSSAGSITLEIHRTSDCARLSSLPVDLGRAIFAPGRISAVGSCEPLEGGRWHCFPARVWRLDRDGRAQPDVAAAQALTRAYYGIDLDSPGVLVPDADGARREEAEASPR